MEKIDVQSLSDEELVKELLWFARYSGIHEPSDPFWSDPRPEGWQEDLSKLKTEVLKRLKNRQ